MLLVGVGKGTRHQDGRGVNFSINLKSLAKSLATAASFSFKWGGRVGGWVEGRILSARNFYQNVGQVLDLAKM